MSLFLNTATSVLQVVTTTTQVLHCSCDTVDMANGATTVSPVVGQNTIINSAATTSIAGSPAASTARAVQSVEILNTDAAAVTITVQRYDGTTTTKIKTGLVLQSGYSLHYEPKRGWYTLDANGIGVVDQTQGPGQYIQTQRVSTGTSITLSSRTNKVRYRMWGGGGQGGGAASTAGECGSGGGAGAYSEGEATAGITPSAALTCAIGAGGSSGATGANGQPGTSTTLTINGTTITAPGGSGGLVGTSTTVPVLGGAGGVAGANATQAIPGAPGEPSIQGTTAGRSGAGASSTVGNGGAAQLEGSNATGNAAGGFGAGGGGGTTTGTARAGGAGSGGLIELDEYTG